MLATAAVTVPIVNLIDFQIVLGKWGLTCSLCGYKWDPYLRNEQEATAKALLHLSETHNAELPS